MPAHPQNLAWIDLEMTGLEPERDRIIEIATIVTDKDLNVLAEGPVFAVHQSDAQLALMDDSTLKELAARWAPDVAAGYTKESTHQALEDIRDSIRELQYYRERLFK